MRAGIYFPLFLVLIESAQSYAIHYLSADLQVPEMFRPRNPLSASAKRAGWQGFMIDLGPVPPGAFVRVHPASIGDRT
jgi:hypothetical protein